MGLLFVFITLPSVISAFDKLTVDNNFTINATGYFGELNRRTFQGVYEDADFDVDLLTTYSIQVEGTRMSLILEQCGLQELRNITFTKPSNLVYNTIPAVSSDYTLGISVLHFKFVVLGNDTEDAFLGHGTLELSGVADSIIIAAYEKAPGNYSVEVEKNKLSGIGKYGSSFKIDAPGYISALTAETLKGIANNPDPGTQQLSYYTKVLENTPYVLAFDRVSVTGLKNISASDTKDVVYENASAVSALYTFQQAVVRVHTMLSLTSDASNITHGYATMNLSGITDNVVVVASQRADGTYRAEVVENNMGLPGTLESIALTEGSADYMKSYVAETYELNKAAISQEVTFIFKMYLENSVRKLDISNHIITN